MKQELFNEVKAVIAEQLGVLIEDITNNSNLVEDLGADSLDTVELIMVLEDKFKIEISDEDAEKLTNIDGIVNFIIERKANG